VTRADDRALLVVAEMIEINAAGGGLAREALRRARRLASHLRQERDRQGQGRRLGRAGADDQGGPTFTEELLAISDSSMAFNYNIIESLPLDRYQSTMAVAQ
jgi:hypothetical protein